MDGLQVCSTSAWHIDVLFLLILTPHVMRMCPYLSSLDFTRYGFEVESFSRRGDDTSEMAVLDFDDILQSHYMKNQALVA